ncbi:MAG TPA: dUTP diphosphatase [Candidatus Kapabacteria bacterium]|jgi:dUTP pyrophosphatase
MLDLRIKRLDPADSDIALPGYATEHAAGMDLRINRSIEIAPGEILMAPTGIAMEIPEGYEGQVRPRSGLAAKHGITCLNTPGTIDADYRGELKVILINHGKETVQFERGTRIAQLIISKYERVEVLEVEDLAESVRASGGFGHTGTH